MEYLLVMSFSGSVMVGIYILLRYLTKNGISARLQYILAKAAVLYYLIPLPFVGKWYERAVEFILPKQTINIVEISPGWDYYVIRANERLYFNNYTKIQVVVAAAWILIALALLMVELSDYLQTSRILIRCMSRIRIEDDESFKTLKEQGGLMRKIIVYQGENEDRTMTFGFFKPVILCGHKAGSKEAELILRHEMIHIRRWDTIWKMLLRFVIFLHWWNPVAWALYFDFAKVCEWSCDEETVSGSTKEETKEYVRLLIYESVEKKDNGTSCLRWGAGFGNGAKRLKKRMDNIMKMKKWNKVAAGMITVALVFVNSLTALAYPNVTYLGKENYVSQNEIDQAMKVGELAFIPDETGDESSADITYFEIGNDSHFAFERQFTDAEGNIYPIQGENNTNIFTSCTHSYITGTIAEHTKNSSGGCTVTYYSAKRCTKCGFILQGDFINEITYAVCTH